MMIVTAPERWATGTDLADYEGEELRVFLAGGITGCPDWQAELLHDVHSPRVTVLNPRRAAFDVTDKNLAFEQIQWEHKALRAAYGISFWFAAETVQPITLYELGAWSMTDKPLLVGCHPDYERRADVKIQTALVRPEMPILVGWETFKAAWWQWAAGLAQHRASKAAESREHARFRAAFVRHE